MLQQSQPGMIRILQNEHGMMKSNDWLEEENGSQSWLVIETVRAIVRTLARYHHNVEYRGKRERERERERVRDYRMVTFDVVVCLSHMLFFAW